MLTNLPRGIISVLQTSFTPAGAVDDVSLVKLIETAMRDGVNGFLAPVVASEVDFLSREEREGIVRLVAATVGGRVPFIVGASSSNIDECRHFASLARQVGAASYLVAVPPALYTRPEEIPGFFEAISTSSDLPLIIQDLEWNGPGLSIPILIRLKKLVSLLNHDHKLLRLATAAALGRFLHLNIALVYAAGDEIGDEELAARQRRVHQ